MNGHAYYFKFHWDRYYDMFKHYFAHSFIESIETAALNISFDEKYKGKNKGTYLNELYRDLEYAKKLKEESKKIKSTSLNRLYEKEKRYSFDLKINIEKKFIVSLIEKTMFIEKVEKYKLDRQKMKPEKKKNSYERKNKYNKRRK